MLVMRNYSQKVLARGETPAQLKKALIERFRTSKIRKFRVKGYLATWEYENRGFELDSRTLIEPEDYSPKEIQAVLDEIEFEGWTFTFEPLSEPRAAIGKIYAVPPAGTGLECERADLDAKTTKRRIVQLTHELVRYIVYKSMVVPIINAWMERCNGGFSYRDQTVFGPKSDNNTLMELLGPPAKIQRFTPTLHNTLCTVARCPAPSRGWRETIPPIRASIRRL